MEWEARTMEREELLAMVRELAGDTRHCPHFGHCA